MAIELIEVNTSNLKSDVESMQGELRAIRSGIGKLKQVESDLSGMWEGNARQAWIAEVENDIRTLESIVSALEKYTERNSEVRTGYERCENQVSQIVSSIRV